MNIQDLDYAQKLKKEIMHIDILIGSIKIPPPGCVDIFIENDFMSRKYNVSDEISKEINQKILDLIILGLEEKIDLLAKKLNKIGVAYERIIYL